MNILKEVILMSVNQEKCKHCGCPIGTNPDCEYCEHIKGEALINERILNENDKGELIQMGFGERLQDYID